MEYCNSKNSTAAPQQQADDPCLQKARWEIRKKVFLISMKKNISEATQTKFLLAPEESQKYVKMPPQDV